MKTHRQINIFDRELLVDNFAGGGGASTGIELAFGRSVDIAINHDEKAVAMHEANHPLTKHFCESVWEVDPREVTDGRPVGLAWFSPDCTHFSRAKGGKPRSKKIRGLAWVAIRWAATVKPRVIFLENVMEFLDWGPLTDDGQPCKKRKGKTFKAFTNALRRQGYEVDWRELSACDYGAPTTRKRLFLIARRDGKPIVWPEPTHGDPESPSVKAGSLKPWRTAAEIIDWSLPCKSIFERQKPLADATLRRIARGIEKFLLNDPEPFIVTCNHSGDGFRGQSLKKPFKTVTASRDAHGIIAPQLMHYRDQPGGKPRLPKLGDPLLTVTAGGGTQAILAPTLIQTGYGERKGQAPRVPGLDKPIGVTPAGGIKHALSVVWLMKNYGGNYTGPGASMKGPAHTITAVDHHSLMSVNMIRFFGTATGSKVDRPARTIMAEGAGGKTGLIAAFLDKYNGSNKFGQSLRDALHTVTGTDGFSLVTVLIAGLEYLLTDIGMRMLEPHELFAAQGFPSGYIICPEHKGKPFTKETQVRMVGNSVSPCVAQALVEANFASEIALIKRKAS